MYRFTTRLENYAFKCTYWWICAEGDGLCKVDGIGAQSIDQALGRAPWTILQCGSSFLNLKMKTEKHVNKAFVGEDFRSYANMQSSDRPFNSVACVKSCWVSVNLSTQHTIAPIASFIFLTSTFAFGYQRFTSLYPIWIVLRSICVSNAALRERHNGEEDIEFQLTFPKYPSKSGVRSPNPWSSLVICITPLLFWSQAVRYHVLNITISQEHGPPV